MRSTVSTAVIEVSGVHWASSKAVTEAVLGRRPGVIGVDANPVSQTATVTYDPARTNIAALTGWVRDCGYHCAGQSVPDHLCDPLAEPTGQAHHDHGPAPTAHHHDEHTHPAPHDSHAVHGGGAGPPRSSQDAMGHGGHHGGMSMDEMVRDMRNRFLVAAVLSVPVLLWSPIGREVFGFTVPAPFGLRDDVFALLLSLPVIFYSPWSRRHRTPRPPGNAWPTGPRSGWCWSR
jgi:Cu2+-exporting ATPase